MWDTHRGPCENTPHGFCEAEVLVSSMQVYSCLEKQEVNFSSWLSTEVDLPGQRLVCRAFYPFPGYTTGAGRETTELTSRMKAVSGLSWGCFTAAKLHWPQQCSHKQEEIPPWVAEWLFPTYIFFLHSVAFFCSHFYFPRKVLQACLWMHIALSFLSSFSRYHKLDQVQKTIASYSPCVIDDTDTCSKTEQKQVLLSGSFETSKYPGNLSQHPAQLSACWLSWTETKHRAV